MERRAAPIERQSSFNPFFFVFVFTSFNKPESK
jgi:hypothetical protein